MMQSVAPEGRLRPAPFEPIEVLAQAQIIPEPPKDAVLISQQQRLARAGEESRDRICGSLRHDDARSLLRAMYSTEADIVPDPQAKTLIIRLHPLPNASSDLAVRHLCAELNATKTLFPGTELRLIYDLVSSQNL
jgi:hypothetical protein